LIDMHLFIPKDVSSTQPTISYSAPSRPSIS
jgi:hypothetical protein